MIWLDSREPKTLLARVQRSLATTGLAGQVQCLASGDYVLFDKDGCSVGIERKTVSDLLSSLASKRVQRQLVALADTYTMPCLLLEGPMLMNAEGRVIAGAKETGWSHAAIQGFLWTTQADGVRLLVSGGRQETADLIRTLASRAKTKCLTTGQLYAKAG